MQKEQQGVITVYLSLILGLVLALVVTTIESARISAGSTLIGRSLQTAMESSLCDYYLPLYDRYQLFGLHIAADTQEEQIAQLNSIVTTRMNENLAPELNSLQSLLSQNQNFLICNPSIQQMNVSNLLYLTGQAGASFKQQAIAYQKYGASMGLIEKMLDAAGVLEETEKANGLIEEKLKAEENFAVIDEQILALIELVEGVETTEDSIRQSWILKRLYVTDYFAKRYVTFKVTPTNVQINNDKIYNALEDEYVNLASDIGDQIESGESSKEWYESIQEMAEDSNLPIEDLLLSLYEDLDASEVILNNWMISKINDMTKTKDIIDQAIQTIDTIQAKRADAKAALDEYAQKLEEQKDSISAELYEELSSDSESMKEYSDTSSVKIGMIPNIVQMRETLVHNNEVLTDIINHGRVSYSYESPGFEAWKSYMEYCEYSMSNYSHTGLVFDYSLIQFNKGDNDILSNAISIVKSGIVSLMVEDMDKLSTLEVSGTDLPSHGYVAPESEDGSSISQTLRMGKRDKISGMGLGSLGYSPDLIGHLLEEIVYLSYLCDHTTNFLSEDYEIGQVIHYEQEYLLYGNLSDKSNFESAVLRILLMRTICNMVHVLSDREKVNEAQAFAVTTIGFTGLPFLVAIAKYVLLFIWALAESMVETAAIIQDKEVGLFTLKENFVVKFSDLLKLSKSFILEKAKNYKLITPTFTLDYGQYLVFLMILRNDFILSYRMMDLIQENLRYEFEDEFRMKNCIICYEASVEGTMPQKFLTFPFIKDLADGINGYVIRETNAVTY